MASRICINACQSIRGSRITVAVVILVLFGCIFAFWHPASQFQGPHLAKSIFQIRSTSCESSEQVNNSRSDHAELKKQISDLTTKLTEAEQKYEKQVNMSKSDLADLSTKNNELKKQVSSLTTRLMEAEQKNGKAEKQTLVVGECEPQKAGPFGTVKGIRTNTLVLADETVNPRLSKILKKIAVQNELIVALANSNIKDILELWFSSIKKVGITNYLVVALDDGIADFCKENDVPFYARDPDEGIDSAGKTGGTLAVSGLKFRILREFLQLGYSVLLSDVDIVYLQNPFDHIYRDSDVESMSDGHDNMTAYGYNDVFNDPTMGWSSIVHTMRIWVYNSGFFYLRPTLPAIELLDRVAERLSHPEFAWDQEVYNEELFFPSHPGYIGLHASKRTMDHYMFMNSKTLFKQVRKDDNLKKLKPVIVHLNYHPDKLPRMKAVMEFYFNGKKDALEPFPDGTN